MNRETATFTLTHGDHTYHFERPADSEALLNEITVEQFEEDEFLPYWAELWPSSHTALTYLPTVLPRHTPLLEIGAGLGVVSTVLAAQGFTMLASDYAEESCSFMQRNAELNETSMHTLCSDWRTPCFTKKFEAIIGIDIVYEERWIAPILLTLEQALSSTGTAYIFDPHRPYRQALVAALNAHPSLVLKRQWDSLSSTGIMPIDCYEIGCMTL